MEGGRPPTRSPPRELRRLRVSITTSVAPREQSEPLQMQRGVQGTAAAGAAITAKKSSESASVSPCTSTILALDIDRAWRGVSILQ